MSNTLALCRRDHACANFTEILLAADIRPEVARYITRKPTRERVDKLLYPLFTLRVSEQPLKQSAVTTSSTGVGGVKRFSWAKPMRLTRTRTAF